MGDSSLHDLLAEHDEQPTRSNGRRRAEKQPSAFKRLLPLLVVVLVFASLSGAGYYGYTWLNSNVNVESEPKDYEGTGSGEVTVTVKEGDSGSDIASELQKKDVIKRKGPFIEAFAANPDAGKISSGTYTLRKHMSSASALDLLLDPASSAGIKVTIPEGSTAKSIYERLSKETGIPVKDFEAAAKDYTSLGVPENPAKSVEGYLWPGTYVIQKDQDAKAILTMMVSQMMSKLKAKGVPENKWHETLTYASIAEKEARSKDDYGRVVRTLHNRLEGKGEAGGHPMPLQLDSTVAYFHGLKSISTTPKQRATKSPYNTYLNPGLPIGPISNPGQATIDAAVNPPKGDWLYWVTVNTQTGETKFATTKAEHDKNVREWKEWARNR